MNTNSNDDIQEIVPGILLGNLFNYNSNYAKTIPNYCNLACHELKVPSDTDKCALQLSWEDLDTTADFIHGCAQRNQKVLVYCVAGKSRSVSAIMSYLIKYHAKTVPECLDIVRRVVPLASPNVGFISHLAKFYNQNH